MAAQPDKKRWWGEHPLLNTILGAILGAVLATALGVVVQRVMKDEPPPPPAPTSSAPTSDRAAILVDWPCLPGPDNDIHVSGSGWHADVEVEIEFPEQFQFYRARALVTAGSFSDRRLGPLSLENYGPLDAFKVTVRGLQSGKQVVEEKHTPSAAAC
jgi:hypothetical protein